MPIALVMQAEKIPDLPDRDQESRAGHESDDDRLGNVAGQVAEPEDRDEDLDDADEDAEQEHRLRRAGLGVGIEERERAEDDERDRVGRAVDQVRGRAEDRRDQRNDDGRVEAVTRIDARDERVGHRLWQRDGGDGEAGEQVAARGSPGVIESHVSSPSVCRSGRRSRCRRRILPARRPSRGRRW